MDAPREWRCPASAVAPGQSATFRIQCGPRLVNGFLVNHAGTYYAYVNRCAHAGTPLDTWPNEFFSDDRRFLACGTHGSLFEPDTGKCAGGPCVGGALFPLQVQVAGDRIVVTASCDP